MYELTGAAVVLISFLVFRLAFSPRRADIPVIGSMLLGGYTTALKTTTSLGPLLLEGYAKSKNHAFQIPDLRSWVVYVSSPELIQEVRKAPDEVLNFHVQVNEATAVKYTMGPTMVTELWHNEIARKVLTSRLGPLVPALWDETCAAFEDGIGPLPHGEWKAVPAHELSLSIISRISNRMFVGLPLCRNKDYTKISIDYTITVMIAGFILTAFPDFLKPIVSMCVSGAPKATRGFERFLLPMIEHRMRKAEELGDTWTDKPDDFLQWLIDAAPPEKGTPKEITLRMMAFNFAAIHSSSATFTSVLYWIALHPEYADELREEAEETQRVHGWTKEGVTALLKADSFVKESMRLHGVLLSTIQRRVLTPLKLSDGTVLPVGANVAANAWGVHHDPLIYPSPWEFDPWRFSRRVDEDGTGAKAREALTSASTEFLSWGHGAHVCPGRHFVSIEFKLMIARLVTTYDVKLATPEMPKGMAFGITNLPNTKAQVLFRRRA